MLSEEALLHNLPSSPAVFFVLRHELSRDNFEGLLAVLETWGPPENPVSKDQYWKFISDRQKGLSRWDSIVPMFKGKREGDWLIAYHASRNTVENIPKQRGYSSYVIDEVRYVIDLFNPANELELPYRGAEEHVVALLLGNAMRQWVPYPVPVRDRLKEIASFYKIIDRFVGILQPERVCGGFYIGRVALAYQHAKECLPAETRPWDLLWTLNVLDVARVDGIHRSELERTFAKVLDITGGRILLQVMPGFDSTMGREYTFASRLLNMTPVTEIDVD